MNNHDRHLNAQLEGFYKIAVVNPETGEENWQTDDWQKNLILNVGMDHIASDVICNQFLVGKSGAGSRPNSINGGTSEVTQSGTTVYLNVRTGLADFTSSNGTYPANVQAGDMIVYANNSQSQVSSVTDGFNLEVSPSYTITTGQTFNIWKTSQTSMESQISNSTSIYVGGGDGVYCGTTTLSNVRTFKRAYDFPTETTQTTYNELGVGWNTSNVFSRIKITPLIIDPGLKLRFIYQLQTAWTPTASVYKTAAIGNWPVLPATNTIGSESLQILKTSEVSATTGATTLSDIGALDPYFISYTGPTLLTMWGSVTGTALAAFGSAVTRTSSGTTTDFSRASYTNGNYYIDKTGVFPTSQLVSNAIYSIGLGNTTNTGQSYAFLFNQTQSKSSAQTLSITFRYAWSRVLA